MRERIQQMTFEKYYKRRAIKGRHWSTLNEEERKMRIEYLWDRIRMYIALKRTIKSVTDDVEEAYIRKMMKSASIVTEDDEHAQNEQIKIAWYLLNKEWTSVIIWELFFSFVVMFNMFTVPCMIAFPEVSQRLSARFLYFELLLEIMWVLQIIQMCITADPPRTTTLSAIVSKYSRSGMLYLDVIATIPSIILLIMGKRSVGKYFMLIRFTHASQFFYPFQLYFDKVSKATKVKKQRLMALVQVFVYILVLDHFMACMWIVLGGRDPEGGTTWLFANNMPDKSEHPIRVWATAFYWVFEVISTVGYGDFSYSSNPEYLFAISLEFIGVIFNAILVGTVMGVTSGDLNFEMLMTEKMDALLVWVKKIELCNKYIETKETQKSLDANLYKEINRFVQDAFLYDFNLIVEEFEMYQKLPPQMQTEVIDTLDTFVVFKQKFDHFFNSCEIGFRNEFIMQMYTREFEAGQEIVAYGKKFREIFFITLGAVNLYSKDEVLFM